MSTERSFVVKSIRRIALSAPALRQAMDAIQARGDQPASVGLGTSDAERDRLCCDGSSSTNPNPGVDQRDTSEGQEGLDSGDPADISDMGGGCLDGVTDCATGEAICFCGDDWIPPEGWDGPTDPPIEEYYDPEKYYSLTSTELEEKEYSNSCIQFAEQLIEWQDSLCNCSASPGGCYTVDEICGDNINAAFQCGAGTAQMTHESCTEDFNEVCGDPPPTEDAWPEDFCINLAIKSGTIVGSKYDPENDGSYSTPMDEIELCDEFGNSFYLAAATTGLYKTIDANKEHGYLWDRNNNKIAHIDGNEYSDPDV